MIEEIICPTCKKKHFVEEYDSGECECGNYYFWDCVLDEETYEEMFSGFYWRRYN